MKRKNNLGFTLIELIISFAILGVATIGIGSYFVVSSKIANKSVIDSQSLNSIQFSENQIKNLLINANIGICYKTTNVETENSALKDKISSKGDSENLLYIFNKENTEVEIVILKWEKEIESIFLKEMTLSNSSRIKGEDIITMENVEDWQLLEEGIKEFDISINEKNNTIKYVLKEKNNYISSNVVRIRNKIIFNNKEDILNKLNSD